MVAMIRQMTLRADINALGIAYYRRPSMLARLFAIGTAETAAFLPAFRRAA
ncbi:MAG: hypothetical protein AAF698_04465 [Pseudomonadota bacterium]